LIKLIKIIFLVIDFCASIEIIGEKNTNTKTQKEQFKIKSQQNKTKEAIKKKKYIYI